MIIKLEDAKKIRPDIEQEDLDAIEHMIRYETNNNFQVPNVSAAVKFTFENEMIATGRDTFVGFMAGDTIQVTGSQYNDGLFTIATVSDQAIQVEGEAPFITTAGRFLPGTVHKVVYPPDVKAGVKKLLQYETATASRIGVKSRTVARMSETYEDSSGYPPALLTFIQRYRRMRWS